MELASTLGIAFGSAWCSGINLYALVTVLGITQIATGKLPGGLAALGNPWIVGLAIVLYCVEFFADKIPWLDSAWDAVHTFIRIPAGAMLAVSAFTDQGHGMEAIALLLGGGLAATTHVTKATTRVVANASPEPFSNILLSVAEDGLVGLVALLFLTHPILGLFLVVLLTIGTVWLLCFLLKRVHGGLRWIQRTLWPFGQTNNRPDREIVAAVVVEGPAIN
jgi:hypothetical protein